MNTLVQFVEMMVSIGAVVAVGRALFSIPDIYSFTNLKIKFMP